MITKRYANDPAKSRSRDLLRASIEETVLTQKKPEEVRVLCLPGVDAQEIFEVYDPLNIPRVNIVGIEIEDGEFREIQEKNLGIELYHGDLFDYVESQRGLERDVVCLDYDGYLTEKNLFTLQKIKDKQVLNSFLLHHANSARREKETSKNLYLDESSFHKYFNQIFSSPMSLRSPEGGLKENWYTNLIVEDFLSHVNEVKNLKKILNFFLGDGDVPFIEHLMEEWKWDSANGSNDEFLEGISRTPIFSVALERTITDIIGGKFSEKWPIRRTEGQELVYYNILSAIKGDLNEKSFSPTDYLKRYKYISESGCPMLGDITLMKRDVKFDHKSHNLARSVGFPKKFKIDKLRDVKKVKKASMDLIRYIQKRRGFDISTELSKGRIDFGSSSKPVLTKRRFLKELNDGISIEEVREKYRGWKNKPLAQWKAHHTMGTYDKKDNQIISSNGNGELSKEEAIHFIQSGVPISEILESYPNSFTKGQLRAFKAHHTMGTYNT